MKPQCDTFSYFKIVLFVARLEMHLNSNKNSVFDNYSSANFVNFGTICIWADTVVTFAKSK